MSEQSHPDVAAVPSAPVWEYFARIAECRTVNQLNAVHISLCNLMTPREVLAVHQWLSGGRWSFPPQHVGPHNAAAFGVALRDHAERMAGDLTYAEKEFAELFARERVAPDVWRFSAGGDRAAKTLVVGFTGNADRLMMPTPTYLQQFDAGLVDIVLLVDRNRARYSQGIAGLGGTLTELTDALPELLSVASYRQVSVTGTSSGGLPAVLAGLRLGAACVLCFGADGPRRWPEDEAHLLLPAWRTRSPATRVTMAFGADHERDRAAAQETADLIGAELFPVAHPINPVKHNAAYPLVTQKQFTAFAATHLGLR